MMNLTPCKYAALPMLLDVNEIVAGFEELVTLSSFMKLRSLLLAAQFAVITHQPLTMFDRTAGLT